MTYTEKMLELERWKILTNQIVLENLLYYNLQLEVKFMKEGEH